MIQVFKLAKMVNALDSAATVIGDSFHIISKMLFLCVIKQHATDRFVVGRYSFTSWLLYTQGKSPVSTEQDAGRALREVSLL
jgi:hypothetical protein